MSRRTLTFFVLTIVTYVVTACATPTSPRAGDTTTTCKGGWGGANTKTCS